ncbi:hypothetical protein [Nocardiopsis xinjiangensis]|uniref:hypothetical protein n=1 Tax=Nocardiopsis xinjiangensis TaxID=124285 RepID=UPI000360E737|nr:hypothetical protein [Nocardiopsis xinjiangensis]
MKWRWRPSVIALRLSSSLKVEMTIIPVFWSVLMRSSRSSTRLSVGLRQSS